MSTTVVGYVCNTEALGQRAPCLFRPFFYSAACCRRFTFFKTDIRQAQVLEIAYTGKFQGFFAQSGLHPSMVKMVSTARVLKRMSFILPPIPARQYILPTPSYVRRLAHPSAISPTSEAPEQGKMCFSATARAH